MSPRCDLRTQHRRSIRLPGCDYASPGACFVTVCVRERECLLGHVRDGEMCSSEYGQSAHEFWKQVPVHFRGVAVDAFVVMPNHLHEIVAIHATSLRAGGEKGEETSPVQTPGEENRRGAVPAPFEQAQPTSKTERPALGQVIAYYTYMTTKQINEMRGTPGIPLWQRNYWELVIPTERALNATREYIADNPARWMWDTYNPAATGTDPLAADLWQLLKQEAK